MATDQDKLLDEVTNREYEHGFVTEIEMEMLPKGLDENTIRFISEKKGEPECYKRDFQKEKRT